MKSAKKKIALPQSLKIIFLSIAIGLFACAISIFAFSSPGSNQPPNGNPLFWLLSGTSMYYSGGSVGIGTSTPGTLLDVNGGVRTGSSAIVTTCGSATEGTQRYNYTTHNMEFCNGTAWTALAATSSGVPAGTIAYFSTTTCPTGWIAANGSNGTPDLRGEFIRGWDNGRNLDSGRGIGTVQTDTIKQTSGLIYGKPHNGTAFVGGGSSPNSSYNSISGLGGYIPVQWKNSGYPDAYGDPTLFPYGSLVTDNGWRFVSSPGVGYNEFLAVIGTGTETRPHNFSLLACQKQ